MTSKLVFKIWQKQFLLPSFLLLFSSLSIITSVVHQSLPPDFSWQCCNVLVKPSWKHSFESPCSFSTKLTQHLGKFNHYNLLRIFELKQCIFFSLTHSCVKSIYNIYTSKSNTHVGQFKCSVFIPCLLNEYIS